MLNNIVVLGNTNGSLFKRLVEFSCIASSVTTVITYGHCGLASVALASGIKTLIFPNSRTALEFSDYVASLYAGKRDVIFIIFYTKILSGRLLSQHDGRIINSHPSLLPLFPGLHGLEQTMSSNNRFLGATLHFITEKVDAGPVLMQAIHPRSTELSYSEARSIVFRLQLIMLLQLFKWVIQNSAFIDDIELTYPVSSSQFEFAPGLFSPSLQPDLFYFYGINKPIV